MDKFCTKSVWQETKTFFPLFFHYLIDTLPDGGTICIVGASDGRYVIPLAKEGYLVTAIESDPILINGGVVTGPNDTEIMITGLRKRLDTEDVTAKVKIINNNFLEINFPLLGDAIFTSSTWDCSINHSQPLRKYIEKMQKIVKIGGVFCAEYMMPCEPHHYTVEHFLEEKAINEYFNSEKWEIVEEFYTPIFKDKPHIGKITPHNHRMGYFMAIKLK